MSLLNTDGKNFKGSFCQIGNTFFVLKKLYRKLLKLAKVRETLNPCRPPLLSQFGNYFVLELLH